MKNKPDLAGRNEGVALVVVLSLLFILTILAVAFASAMWVERLAAWNHANSVRAGALVNSAVATAMNEVNLYQAGKCYPRFTNSADALCSGGSTNMMTDLLTGEAYALIPASLRADANAAATNCRWSDVVVDGKTYGRIAYVVVNSSGLIDVNRAGGNPRGWSTNISQIDPLNLLDTPLTNFVSTRTRNRRYETMTEAMMMPNTGIPKPLPLGPGHDGFAAYSLDPARDKYFPMASSNDMTRIRTIGRPDAVLANKFNINAIARKETNGQYRYPGYTQSWNLAGYANDPRFMSEYYYPLEALLATTRSIGGTMMERTNDVAWNIINYLDPDRIPQGNVGDNAPWTHSEGGEAIPLANEIVLRPYDTGPSPIPAPPIWPTNNTFYEFVVEYWYPFAPVSVSPADNFFVWVGVFTNHWNGEVEYASAPSELSITNYAFTNFSFTFDITNMSYGGNEFLCFTSPINKKISFPTRVYVTNPVPGYVTNYLPIGIQKYADGPGTTRFVTNRVWFLSRTYKREYNPASGAGWISLPVDEAMGYLAFDGANGEGYTNNVAPEDQYKRQLREFRECRGYSVPDPRSNGQIKYWTQRGNNEGGGSWKNVGGWDYAWNDPVWCTLGTTNHYADVAAGMYGVAQRVGCDPWSRKGSGLPIFNTNGPMENIGELGYIWRSNLDDEQPAGFMWWRTINLMHFDEGAALLDWMTIRPTNAPEYGLFNIGSRQTNAVKAPLFNMKVGYVSGPDTNMYSVKTADIAFLAATIISNGPYINYRSMFTTDDADDGGGGPVANAFRRAGTNSNAEARGDLYGEDVFRKVCELITFRHNLFTVAVAAQVFGGDGATVVGEKRAVATIYRDAYTGRYFIRSFKWLSD